MPRIKKKKNGNWLQLFSSNLLDKHSFRFFFECIRAKLIEALIKVIKFRYKKWVPQNDLAVAIFFKLVIAPPVKEWQRSKLEDGRCQVQTPVVLVDQVVRSFSWCSPKIA